MSLLSGLDGLAPIELPLLDSITILGWPRRIQEASVRDSTSDSSQKKVNLSLVIDYSVHIAVITVQLASALSSQ